MSSTTGRWEYHIARLAAGAEVDSDALNRLGADRWELVAIAQGQDDLQTLIFKRPTPTLAEQITLDQRTRVENELHSEQRAEQPTGHEGGTES